MINTKLYLKKMFSYLLSGEGSSFIFLVLREDNVLVYYNILDVK